MTTSEFGKLEYVPVRDIWHHEEHDFTPWLAKNLHLLGEAVDMKLSLIQTEASDWSGDLDILAETDNQDKVAIENQIEPSDSNHLARLIGYAANYNAQVLIWVAPEFSRYHLKMLGWLKIAMAGNREIHAVKISLAPGGDLRPAGTDATGPGFRAVFAPVDLDKTWSKPRVLTPEDREYLPQRSRAFFQRLLRDLRSKGFTDTTAPQAGQNLSFPSGFSGVTYNAGFGWDAAFVYLWIYVGNRTESNKIFDALSQFQSEITGDLSDVQFDVIGQYGGWRRASIGMSRDGHLADSDKELHEIRTWMVDAIARLKMTIEPRLQEVMTRWHGEETTQ